MGAEEWARPDSPEWEILAKWHLDLLSAHLHIPTLLDPATDGHHITRHLGTVFQGIWTTGQYLFPFVLAKSLAAPGWLVTLSVMMETTGMVMGLYWGELMATGGRRRALFWGGLVGRGILVTALLALVIVGLVVVQSYCSAVLTSSAFMVVK